MAVLMGYGDELMGAGLARGAATRGKRIAFGDGRKIHWSPQAHEIFRGNDNVAPPGSEGSSDLDWIAHYRGHRLYARAANGRWVWDYSFKARPGEIRLTADETDFASRVRPGFILIEPSVKRTAPNKQWPVERYAAVSRSLSSDGYRVVQVGASALLPGAQRIETPSFRHALAVLARAALYIGPEGGLHHGAAALEVPAVVIFGGFIDPRLTGYAGHVNLYAGGEACGTIGVPCAHCRAAMAAISVEDVLAGVSSLL